MTNIEQYNEILKAKYLDRIKLLVIDLGEGKGFDCVMETHAPTSYIDVQVAIHVRKLEDFHSFIFNSMLVAILERISLKWLGL